MGKEPKSDVISVTGCNSSIVVTCIFNLEDYLNSLTINRRVIAKQFVVECYSCASLNTDILPDVSIFV